MSFGSARFINRADLAWFVLVGVLVTYNVFRIGSLVEPNDVINILNKNT